MLGPVLDGIVLGCIITLGAVGITLVADILNFFNFYHGALFTLGAYVTYMTVQLLPEWSTFPFLSFGMPMVIGMIVSMVVTSLVALVVDWSVFKTLRSRGATPLFLALTSLGVAFVLRSVVNLIWGPEVKYYSRSIQMSLQMPMGIRLRPDEIFIMALTLVLVMVAYLFLKYTRLGKAMRAMSDDSVLARASGISTDRVINWTWIIAASLAAMGGTLYGISVQLRPTMGWTFLIPLFVAVIVGGIGSFWGAFVGGMIIGIAEEVLTSVLQHLFFVLEWKISMSAYKPAIAFVLIVIVLLVKPEGIFGKQEG